METDETDIIYQKELVYNKLLPYANLLHEESNNRLSVIKGFLGRSIQLQDFEVGTVHWVAQLSRFIKLFGYRFSKKDHITFVKTLFELTTLPNLDFGLVQKFAQCLALLLKKRELLSRDDVMLPWRPLYNVYKNATDSPLEEYGLIFLPIKIEETLRNLIIACRPYFAQSATKEMLDEWRPLFCPLDVTMTKAGSYLELFLPTSLPPEQHDCGFCLWFDELMQLWNGCSNNFAWEMAFVNLFNRAAKDHLGYINWQPYVAQIFTRILASFGLPVSANKSPALAFVPSYDVATIASWVVSMLGTCDGIQAYLNKLLKATESYYHPSNAGMWTPKLLLFLAQLSRALVDRIFRERYKPSSWETPIPQSAHLTDADITSFVKSLLPIVLVAMFSKGLRADVAIAFQHLAVLRPEIVIPPLLEQTYPALETLIEPHRLTACLMCLNTVCRSMVSSKQWYPQGRMHVIPLLNLCLPGIDPNDSRKSMITFQLISTLCSLVPIVNSSNVIHSRNDLTEDERELCSLTSQFEDFVLLFLDRVISFVENSSHEHTRSETTNMLQLDQEEKIVGMGLLTVASTVLQQCSAAIYEEALRKLCSFVIGSVFEIHVGGIYVAVLVQAAVKARPEKALQVFVPYFINIVKSRANHEIQNEEHLDAEFIWSVKMLTELASSECNLLAHLSDFVSTLELILHVKSKRVRELGGQMLRQMLKYLTSIYPNEYKSTIYNFDDPSSSVLPIHEWGKPGDLNNLNMSWHIPSDAEKTAATNILSKFLIPELKAINTHIKSNNLSREELLQTLMIVNHCIVGASFMLPPLQGDEIKLADNQVELRRFDVIVKNEDMELTLDGQNIRMMILETIRPLLSHILATSADDTKCLTVLIRIYSSLLYVNGITKLEYNSRCNGRAISKKALENRLIPKKKHMRILLVDRVALQHEMRIVYRTHEKFTTTHRDILKDMFRLAVSDYGLVRQVAQTNVWLVFRSFVYSYKILTDDILDCFHSEGVSKERFKGALYLILGNNQHSLLTKRHWDFVSRLWPALIRAQHSEDPSVVKLFDLISGRLKQEYQTLSLGMGISERQLLSNMDDQIVKFESELTMIATEGIDFIEVESPDDANTQQIEGVEKSPNQEALRQLLEETFHLWDENSIPVPAISLANDSEIKLAAEQESLKSSNHLKLYYSLVNDLVSFLEITTVWRFYQLALDMLSFLVRHDIRLPANAVRLLAKGIVSDSLPSRQSCLSTLTSVLKQQKRKHLTVQIDPYAVASQQNAVGMEVEHVVMPGILGQMQPGDRHDNLWLQYRQKNVPSSPAAWNKFVFIEKTHIGYYTWPSPTLVYASYDKQPKLGRQFDELPDDEKPIYEMFTDATFLDKFFRFLSIEEHRAHDKFQLKNFLFFKGLFRNFDDTFLPLIRPHLENLISDKEHSTRDTSQRCVAEVLAAVIRSSKHWNFERVQKMWEWVIPILKTALVNITTETLRDWTIFCYFAVESRDPHKVSPLLELLMEDPIRGNGGSFGDCSRLTMLQAALGQQEWRVSELLHRLLAYLEPNITHPYKNVRDEVGSMLMNVFLPDSVFPNAMSHTPHVAPYMCKIHAKLIAWLSTGTISTKMNVSTNQANSQNNMMETDDSAISDLNASEANASILGIGKENGTETGSEEEKSFVRTCKTVFKLLQDYLLRSLSGISPEMLKFLPIICQLERDSDDEDLRNECTRTLALIGQARLSPSCVPLMLNTVRQILSSDLWHARETALKLLQVIVFSNLFVLQEHNKNIENIVIDKLSDPHVEVRAMASITLSGLFQCDFLQVTDDVTKRFIKMSRTPVVKKLKNDTSEQRREEQLLIRHAGVLGLCACILAYPYDVPDFMPELLMKLSEHVNDPQPIQMTVKKSLSNFKRTHHDSWHNHKQRFTDDQLSVLTELLVSPNYYA